jgi:uncharacterized DUF497 family protein
VIFEWDSSKAEANLRKHGISFEVAATVFDDSLHLSIVDPASSAKEERWITIGRAVDYRTVLVVHTYKIKRGHEESVRIISARLATRKEKKQYEEGI